MAEGKGKLGFAGSGDAAVPAPVPVLLARGGIRIHFPAFLHPMNRRRFLRQSTAAAAAFPLAGCGGKAGSAETLNVFLWAEYLPDDVVNDFSKEAGCRVQVDTYNSNEEMMAKAATGNCGYDIVCPSQYAVSDMARQRLLAELDRAALRGLGNLDGRFTGLKSDPDGKFAVPYLGASTGIGYHRGSLPNPPRSWAGLFDAVQLEPLRGRLSMLDDAREAPAAALFALGLSPNATAEADIRRAGEQLKTQKPFVACYDSEAFEDKLASGSCSIVQGYAGDFVAVMEKDPQLDFFLPSEGAVFNMDCLCVLAQSPRIPLALKFLDFVLRPDIAARISSGTGYVSANAKAPDLLGDSLKNHPCFRIPAEDKLVMLDDPGPAVKDLYTGMWESVKQA